MYAHALLARSAINNIKTYSLTSSSQIIYCQYNHWITKTEDVYDEQWASQS